MDLIPAISSNTDFIKYAVFYYALWQTVDLIMAPWTFVLCGFDPGHSNSDFIKYASLFLLTEDFMVHKLMALDSWIRGFDPGHEFKHVISSDTSLKLFFAHCGFLNNNNLLKLIIMVPWTPTPGILDPRILSRPWIQTRDFLGLRSPLDSRNPGP